MDKSKGVELYGIVIDKRNHNLKQIPNIIKRTVDRSKNIADDKKFTHSLILGPQVNLVGKEYILVQMVFLKK